MLHEHATTAKRSTQRCSTCLLWHSTRLPGPNCCCTHHRAAYLHRSGRICRVSLRLRLRWGFSCVPELPTSLRCQSPPRPCAAPGYACRDTHTYTADTARQQLYHNSAGWVVLVERGACSATCSAWCCHASERILGYRLPGRLTILINWHPQARQATARNMKQFEKRSDN
jgi:hypothetical protein